MNNKPDYMPAIKRAFGEMSSRARGQQAFDLAMQGAATVLGELQTLPANSQFRSALGVSSDVIRAGTLPTLAAANVARPGMHATVTAPKLTPI